MVVDASNHSRRVSARRYLKVLFLPQRYYAWHIDHPFAAVAKILRCRRNRRRTVRPFPRKTTPGGLSLQAWPRFEVCIDGRCPIEDTLNAIPYELRRNQNRWNLKRLA